MHVVLLASHTPETGRPRVQSIAETAGVKIEAGPFVNRTACVLPSLTMDEGIAEIREQSAIF